MNKRLRNILIGLILLGVLGGGVYFAYVLISGGSGEASRPISAPTLEADTASASNLLFRISPEESRVRFLIDEELRGSPNRVVGETNQVAGDILVDRANPSNTQVGTIVVNVRTLATDSDLRDRATRSQILESAKAEYEFSQFVPTGLTGLPAEVAVGQAFSFQVAGDLTIRNITNPVTFEMTVTPVSETRLEGQGSATVTRDAYQLSIPSVPGVANVSDDVRLEIEFVALLVESTTP